MIMNLDRYLSAYFFASPAMRNSAKLVLFKRRGLITNQTVLQALFRCWIVCTWLVGGTIQFRFRRSNRTSWWTERSSLQRVALKTCPTVLTSGEFFIRQNSDQSIFYFPSAGRSWFFIPFHWYVSKNVDW